MVCTKHVAVLKHSYTYLMVVHFDWHGGGYLCKHNTTQNLQPYCISEMQTLWGETEQVMVNLVTIGKLKIFEKSIFRLVLTLKPYIAES